GDHIEIKRFVHALRNYSQTEDLAQNTVDFKGAAGFFSSLTGKDEIGKMVRGALGHFGKFGGHVRRYFFRDNRQSTSMTASFEDQVLAVDNPAWTQCGLFHRSLVGSRHIGSCLGSAKSLRQRG